MTCAPDSLCRAVIDTIPDAVKAVVVLYAIVFVGLWVWLIYENWAERRRSR